MVFVEFGIPRTTGISGTNCKLGDLPRQPSDTNFMCGVTKNTLILNNLIEELKELTESYYTPGCSCCPVSQSYLTLLLLHEL